MNPKGGVKLPPLKEIIKEGIKDRIEEKSTPSNAEEQAMELARTVKCRLGPSKVHGVGVIALQDIKKGEQLYCALTVKPHWYNVSYANLKKYLSHRKDILQLLLDRWPNIVNGSAFISPNYDARLISFMNHADEPNYDPKTDLATKDIKAGEEVFEDYRTIENYSKAFPWLDKKKK